MQFALSILSMADSGGLRNTLSNEKKLTFAWSITRIFFDRREHSGPHMVELINNLKRLDSLELQDVCYIYNLNFELK